MLMGLLAVRSGRHGMQSSDKHYNSEKVNLMMLGVDMRMSVEAVKVL